MSFEQHQKIYVISGVNKCKIGISSAPTSRLNDLKTNCFEELTLAYASELHTNARLVERVCHRLLKDKKLKGEWFNISSKEAIELVTKAINLVNLGDH